MKDHALRIARAEDTEVRQLNRLREYCQHVIMREMFADDWLDDLVFHGGTALRMVHGLNRFSEDLDFHLHHQDTSYSIDQPSSALKRQLERQGYSVDLSTSQRRVVKSVMVKFKGLQHEAGISPHKDQKLAIKIEVDTRPPLGFETNTHSVTRFLNFALTTHTPATLLAGKCHALLQRSYCKGRDFYDLQFYLNRWPDIIPTISYLNAALQQTRYEGPVISESNWREQLHRRVERADWEIVQSDVEPFLEDPVDLKMFRKDLLLDLLQL